MSGHSKWNNIAKRKGANDAKKAKIFTKIGREMAIAIKEGGSANPDFNARLRDCIAKAKANNMPNDNIKRVLEKAASAGQGDSYESITYEGHGPSGIAVIVETMTDNRNRTAADVRAAFNHHGGNLGTSGSVAFQFEKKGQILVEKVIKSEQKKVADKENAVDEDEFMMAVAEAGGSDYEDAGEEWIVYTAPTDLMTVKKGLEEQGIEVKGAEFIMEPTTPTEVTVADAKKVMRLVDRLEELEDLQNVYHTMDITDEIAAALDEEE